ncbi:high affinity cationic amino acid transporter 1-like isoform X1 [Schistocerca americana]|uniref:high affinity cationic amino acid transporter 1-like isoform X1 n=1 Tax=Schistocerca americana TaxID=7009 RepID=UPI001F4F7A61|nr:high affinity cationic amino acid transporter 1-like isoform X1 [Schistocerca americana]
MFGSLVQKMSRKKQFDDTDVSKSSLARVLSLFDLIALGVGSTLGLGVYVISGSVSRTEAGPGIIISFLIAAIASMFAGLCYAEFAARVPRAGSAYIYSYVTVGEFIAFLIGWNLILEYVIGAASVARGLTGYIDSLVNNAISNASRQAMPIDVDFLSDYPDFLAFGITFLLTILLAFGVKESSIITSIMSITNLGVLTFAIVAGALKADVGNWQIEKNDIPDQYNGGEGGFVPFGIAGIIKGAATCFYAFVGFDAVATTGEEAINPQRNIPLSIIFSLLIVFCCYFGVSTVLTLMLPYYLQDMSAPLSYAFQKVGWNWAGWIISAGAIFGLGASFLGAMFPLPRIIYAMSSDRLLFPFLGKVHHRFKTPFIGTICAGTITAVMALIFNVDQLVSMLSIGTLTAYSMVAACVLLLRYTGETGEHLQMDEVAGEKQNADSDEETRNKQSNIVATGKQILNIDKLKRPTKLSTKIVAYEIVLYFILCILTSQLVIQAGSSIEAADPLAISGLVIVLLCMVCMLISIGRQPVSEKKLNFKVPFIPILPATCIFVNTYLMMMLDVFTWIRFGVWIIIGLLIYFTIGFCISDPEDDSTNDLTAQGMDNLAYVQNVE